MQREILYQATHDKLTDLPNRRLLYDLIKQHIVTAKRNNAKIAVLFFDLDRFKLINDSLGHSSGDLVLRLIAKRISSAIRESDTLARIGGDEFVIVLSGAEERIQVETVTKKILKAVIKPFILHRYEFS